MKKFIGLFLICLFATLITGCGSDKEDGKDILLKCKADLSSMLGGNGTVNVNVTVTYDSEGKVAKKIDMHTDVEITIDGIEDYALETFKESLLTNKEICGDFDNCKVARDGKKYTITGSIVPKNEASATEKDLENAKNYYKELGYTCE